MISQDQIDWFLQESGTLCCYCYSILPDWTYLCTASIDPIERPFHPDGAKDIGDLWARQATDQVTPDTRRLAKPNALVFFHIPLYVRHTFFSKSNSYIICRQESYAAADINPLTGRPLDVGLHDLEESGAAKKQDGFYHKGVLQAMESDHRAGGNAREVKVISNGHCHSAYCILSPSRWLTSVQLIILHLVTENCRRVSGVWSCFGGGG